MNNKDDIIVFGNLACPQIDFIGNISMEAWNRRANEMQVRISSLDTSEVFVTLSSCESCVPIAIASLFLSLIRTRTKTTIWISSESPSGKREFFYMLSEMWIGKLCQANNITVILDEEELADFSILNSTQGNCTPLYIFDANKVIIRDFVDEACNMIDSNADNSIEPIIKVKNILHETISNIKEHAYSGEEEAYAAMFVRKCCSIKSKGIGFSNRDIQRLYSNRNREYYQQIEGFYEVVVADEGVGMASTLRVKNQKGSITKYPLSYSMTKTFIEDDRIEREGDYKSYYSGLNFIFKLICENGDYVFGREGEEYVELRGSRISPLTRAVFQNLNPYKGVVWIFHIASQKADFNNGQSVAGPYMHGKNERILEETSSKEELSRRISSIFTIIDEREHFRNVHNEFIEIDQNPIGIIWLTDAIRTKNDLLNTIQKKCSTYKDSCKHLIIGDVIESELTTFFCALDNWLCPTGFRCDKIVVISHNLRVQVFVKKRGRFYFSKTRADEYWASKGNSVLDSLSYYYNFITKLDSSVFWSRVFQKKSRDYLVVRGNTTWEGGKLSYYLNLEMILGDRELYGMIRHSLRRVSGLLEKKCVYTSTDILMKKMCIDLDYECAEEKPVIYVGSVFVTGRTEGIIETTNEDIKMCVFVNYFDNPEQSQGVHRLYIWPSRKILDNIIPFKSIQFMRRGNTPSMCNANKKTMEDSLKSQKTNCIRHYDDTMQDIASLYGGFIKMGHFNYHNNHDFFSINQREILRISAYEKRGPFEYLFKRFMLAIGKEYSNQVVNEWKERVNAWECGDGIFVYRMHYYTNYLFDLVDHCFNKRNCEIWEYVIPLESFEKKSEQMPLMVSDMTLQHLSDLVFEKMQKNSECMVTIFDTMNVTGKTMREMRDIVNNAFLRAKLRAKKEKLQFDEKRCKINEFTLFDAKTRRYDEILSSYESYYHFDLPRMGSKEKCTLCTVIENCNNSKQLLNSEYAKERMNKWLTSWKAVSPIYSSNLLGDVVKRVVRNFDDQECLFSTFAMQLVEMAFLSNNRNYLYEVCNKRNDLYHEEKILLLCIQILLFPQDDSFKHYNEVYSELFFQLNQIEEVSPVTALASMIGLRANETTVKKVFNTRLKQFEYLANEDIKIMFATLCASHKELQEVSFYSEVSDLLKEKENIDIELLKVFHNQIYNAHGVAHTTRLDRIQKPFADYRKLYNYCNSVNYSLEKIASIVRAVNPLLIRCERAWDKEDKFIQQNEKKHLLNIIVAGEKRIEQMQDAVVCEKRDSLNEEEIEFVDKEIEYPLKRFHRYLFLPYGKSGSVEGDEGVVNKPSGKDIEEALLSIMAEVSRSSYENMPQDDIRRAKAGVQEEDNRVFFYYDKDRNRELKFFFEFTQKESLRELPKNLSEVWYLWNQYIVDEIYYLFGDIRHSVGVVEHRTYDDLNLVTRIVADKNELILTFDSYSEKSSKEIKELVHLNRRYQREAIEKFNVTIDYLTGEPKDGRYHLCTKVTIPAIEGGRKCIK